MVCYFCFYRLRKKRMNEDRMKTMSLIREVLGKPFCTVHDFSIWCVCDAVLMNYYDGEGDDSSEEDEFDNYFCGIRGRTNVFMTHDSGLKILNFYCAARGVANHPHSRRLRERGDCFELLARLSWGDETVKGEFELLFNCFDIKTEFVNIVNVLSLSFSRRLRYWNKRSFYRRNVRSFRGFGISFYQRFWLGKETQFRIENCWNMGKIIRLKPDKSGKYEFSFYAIALMESQQSILHDYIEQQIKRRRFINRNLEKNKYERHRDILHRVQSKAFLPIFRNVGPSYDDYKLFLSNLYYLGPFD